MSYPGGGRLNHKSVTDLRFAESDSEMISLVIKRMAKTHDDQGIRWGKYAAVMDHRHMNVLALATGIDSVV